jgi:predicted GNAT family N-acyltransferase
MAPAEDVAIRWARDREDVRAAIAVREQVFCVEQGVPREEEVDGLDEGAQHLLALAPAAPPGEPRVIGTLRLLLLDGGVAKIGRVAVEADWRRRGIASLMLDAALTRARQGGRERARLASQLAAVGLYERAGFAVESEPFEEAGIAHVWMGLRLASPRHAA